MRSSIRKNKRAVGKVLLPSLLINLLSLAVPLTVLQIYDRILPNQSYGTATLLLMGAFLALMTEGLIRFIRSWLLSAVASNTERETYQHLVELVGHAPASQLQRIGAGGVEEGLNAVSKVKDWYSGGIAAGFIDLPFAIIFLALVGYIGEELVLIPVVVWLITLIVVWVSSQKSKKLSVNASRNEQARKAYLILLGQTLQGIKRQAVESRVFNQFRHLNNARYLSKAKEEQQNTFAQECIQLAALATSVILVIIGSLWVLNGDLTTGGLAACSILSGRAVAPLSALIGIRIKANSIHSANNAIERLESLELQESKNIDLEAISDIEIDGFVIERYGREYQVNVRARSGDLVLFINKDRDLNRERDLSGVVMSSLAGVDDVAIGNVSIGGEKVHTASLANYIAYCGVKGHLVAGTILDNLCGFDPERADKASEYAKSLGLDKEVTRLPDGLETKIGHNSSSSLSMGNIKLLNIAAQLSSPKPIVVLERPDTSLDLESLERLFTILRQEMSQGRIILMVSHHPKLQALATQYVEVQSLSEQGEAV